MLLVGATAGIGKETVRLLAQAGYLVIIVGRNQGAGAPLAAELGGLFIRADLSLMSETRRVADAVSHCYRPVSPNQPQRQTHNAPCRPA